eukprot:6184145-Pleurochrysis_carterae.AAC.1
MPLSRSFLCRRVSCVLLDVSAAASCADGGGCERVEMRLQVARVSRSIGAAGVEYLAASAKFHASAFVQFQADCIAAGSRLQQAPLHASAQSSGLGEFPT